MTSLRLILPCALLLSCADTLVIDGAWYEEAGGPADQVSFKPPGPEDVATPGSDSRAAPADTLPDRFAPADVPGPDSSPADVPAPDLPVLPDLVAEEPPQLLCQPGTAACAGNQVQTCNPDGMSWSTSDCLDQYCLQGKCVPCVPGTRKCEGETVLECAVDGLSFAPVETCDFGATGTVCAKGSCVSPCEASSGMTSTGPTNEGCEYWSVDMDQSQEFGGMDSQFAIVVSNTNDKLTATATVTNDAGTTKEVQVPPDSAVIINLDPYNIVGVMKGKRAWRVQSNIPIVAYQFNPLENVGVFSNDASLLLPTYALGKKYRVMAWPHRPGAVGLASAFTVVGTSPDGTNVTVKVSAPTAAGDGIPALAAGQEWNTTLAQFEVLNLETQDAFQDLTGTVVEADQPVALFGGHVCANCPHNFCQGGKCIFDPDAGGCSSHGDCPIIAACDHLEEQIQPLNAWGLHYVIGKTWPRGKAPDFIRVLASQPGTTVTLNPPVASIPQLGEGQYVDFETSSHVEVKADKPILVGQYLEGQDAPGHVHTFCEDAFIFGQTCGGDLFGDS